MSIINIPGLRIIDDIITVEEEQLLINNINNMEWNTELKRRTQHYGYKYPYNRSKKLISTTPIPDFLLRIVNDLNVFLDKEFDQVIINEYTKGQGISAHIDDQTLFKDTIVGLSLGSNTIMTFYNNITDEKIDIELKAKSLLILQDDARNLWKHSILPKNIKDIRISVTFREIEK